MNKLRLESVMKLHGDNGGTLSEYLGIARSTFSAKINGTNGADFTNDELIKIRDKYNLDADGVYAIFFE